MTLRPFRLLPPPALAACASASPAPPHGGSSLAGTLPDRGPFSNKPQFQAAFGCAAGTPMVRQNRCEVW